MTERITQQGADQVGASGDAQYVAGTVPEGLSKEKGLSVDSVMNLSVLEPTTVIWTPAFLVIFVVVVVVALSVESLLTQGWLAHYYSGQWIMQTHVLLIGSGWAALAFFALGPWVRAAALFGLLLVGFLTLDILVGTQNIDPASPLQAHLNAAACLSLLGVSLCLSLNHVPLRRWDTWFFVVAPLSGCLLVVLLYLLTPADVRTLLSLESATSTAALALSFLLWWGRPSCWMAQPGTTFLSGLVPLFLLLKMLVNPPLMQFNAFFAQVIGYVQAGTFPLEHIFFYSQVTLLCLLLALLRIFQGERCRRKVIELSMEE